MRKLLEYYSVAKALYTKLVAPVCQRFSLTYMEFTVLMFLANNPEYDTAAKIVKYRQLTKSHVSMSLRALQQRQLIVGRQLEDDRRTIHLSLTDRAKAIVEAGHTAQEAFSRCVFDGFSPEETAKFQEFQGRIDHNMSVHLEAHQSKENHPHGS